MDKEIEGEKIESWESCNAEEYTHTKCQQKRRAQTKHLNQSATKRWSITTVTILQSRRGPDLSGAADRAGRAALALRDSHSSLLSHLFVFSLPLCPSSLTALSTSPPLSRPISLFPFWLLSAASSPCPHLLLHSPYISVWYPPSVICCLTPPAHTSHSFSLPQSNSRSFTGIIRWILLSLWSSFL